MNRRGFLLGGGILGWVTAALSATAQASRPEGSLVPCKESHEPVAGYLKQSAIQIHTTGEGARSLIPCRRCGVLFALNRQDLKGAGL